MLARLRFVIVASSFLLLDTRRSRSHIHWDISFLRQRGKAKLAFLKQAHLDVITSAFWIFPETELCLAEIIFYFFFFITLSSVVFDLFLTSQHLIVPTLFIHYSFVFFIFYLIIKLQFCLFSGDGVAGLPRVQCPNHPDSILVEDYRAGDMICPDCGLVVGQYAKYEHTHTFVLLVRFPVSLFRFEQVGWFISHTAFYKLVFLNRFLVLPLVLFFVCKNQLIKWHLFEFIHVKSVSG